MLDAKASKGSFVSDVGDRDGASARSLLELGLIVDRDRAVSSGSAAELFSDLEALREASIGGGAGSLKTMVERNYAELSEGVSDVSARMAALEGENLDSRLSSLEGAALPSRVAALEEFKSEALLRISQLEAVIADLVTDLEGGTVGVTLGGVLKTAAITSRGTLKEAT